MSTSLTYLRYELLRTVRNTRFFIFSLIFPLILFYVVAGANKSLTLGGIPFPTYYLAGMISWGTMAAVLAGGARIAAERSVGWNRQLRLTPLTPRTYFRAKVITGYALAAVSIVLLCAAGVSLGVHLSPSRWATMIGLILLGLIPFAALGVWLGHVLTVDSMGPALGGITALFALLGGAWGPIGQSGFMLRLIELLPSYWLVQAGHVAYTGETWPAKAWIVIAVWAAVFTELAARAYRRDTQRV
jgi:ABC-2 type transport system permease protein